MALIERIAGAPSPRSTMCRSEKFTKGHLTRSRASSSTASFWIVIKRGASTPSLSDAVTQAFEIWTDSFSAPSAGEVHDPIVKTQKPNDVEIDQRHRIIEATRTITNHLSLEVSFLNI
jgi:hypothetical protein